MSAYQPTQEELASSCRFPKEVGDIVRLGDNAGPEFEIVHIEGQTAWIRKPVTFADEALVPVSRLAYVRSRAVRQPIFGTITFGEGKVCGLARVNMEQPQ
jgi:hypothetical protein